MIGQTLGHYRVLEQIGAALYEMATGRRPFPPTSAPMLTDAILRQAPVPPRAVNLNLSPDLERILTKSLEMKPENHYSSAKELGVDLRRLAVSQTAAPLLAVAPERKGFPRAGMVAAVSVVVVLLSVVIGTLVLLRQRAAPGGVNPGNYVLKSGDTMTGTLTVPGLASARVNSIHFADGFASIQAAITDAGITGTVLITPGYTGTDAFTNPNRIAILDLRGATNYRGFVWVKDYGAKGDGVTDDTAALGAAIAAMPASGGTLQFQNGATYMVNSSVLYGLYFNGLTNFKIFGNGATIKVINGSSAVGGYNMMTFQSSSNGYVETLVLDSNRANRTVANLPAGAYPIQVLDNTRNIRFVNVRSINSVIDGFDVAVTAGNQGNLSAYPTDIVFEDCIADNSVRVGLSLVASNRAKVIGGRYVNTNLRSPQAGIDIEPDAGSTFGNLDSSLLNVEVSGNAGYGLILGGSASTPNKNVVLNGLRGSNNGDGFLSVGQATNVSIINTTVGAHSTAVRGIVDVGTQATNVKISNLTMHDITASGRSNAGLYVHGAAVGPIVVENLKFATMSPTSISASQAIQAIGISITTSSATFPCIILDTAARHVLRNVTITGCTGSPIYVAGADAELDGITIIDYGASASAGIQFEAGATGSIAQNISVFQTVGIPAGTYAIRYNGVQPKILRNVRAKSAGTDFTPANTFGFLGGTSFRDTR